MRWGSCVGVALCLLLLLCWHSGVVLSEDAVLDTPASVTEKHVDSAELVRRASKSPHAHPWDAPMIDFLQVFAKVSHSTAIHAGQVYELITDPIINILVPLVIGVAVRLIGPIIIPLIGEIMAPLFVDPLVKPIVDILLPWPKGKPPGDDSLPFPSGTAGMLAPLPSPSMSPQDLVRLAGVATAAQVMTTAPDYSDNVTEEPSSSVFQPSADTEQWTEAMNAEDESDGTGASSGRPSGDRRKMPRLGEDDHAQRWFWYCDGDGSEAVTPAELTLCMDTLLWFVRMQIGVGQVAGVPATHPLPSMDTLTPKVFAQFDAPDSLYGLSASEFTPELMYVLLTPVLRYGRAYIEARHRVADVAQSQISGGLALLEKRGYQSAAWQQAVGVSAQHEAAALLYAVLKFPDFLFESFVRSGQAKPSAAHGLEEHRSYSLPKDRTTGKSSPAAVVLYTQRLITPRLRLAGQSEHTVRRMRVWRECATSSATELRMYKLLWQWSGGQSSDKHALPSSFVQLDEQFRRQTATADGAANGAGYVPTVMSTAFMAFHASLDASTDTDSDEQVPRPPLLLGVTYFATPRHQYEYLQAAWTLYQRCESRVVQPDAQGFASDDAGPGFLPEHGSFPDFEQVFTWIDAAVRESRAVNVTAADEVANRVQGLSVASENPRLLTDAWMGLLARCDYNQDLRKHTGVNAELRVCAELDHVVPDNDWQLTVGTLVRGVLDLAATITAPVEVDCVQRLFLCAPPDESPITGEWVRTQTSFCPAPIVRTYVEMLVEDPSDWFSQSEWSGQAVIATAGQLRQEAELLGSTFGDFLVAVSYSCMVRSYARAYQPVVEGQPAYVNGLTPPDLWRKYTGSSRDDVGVVTCPSSIATSLSADLAHVRRDPTSRLHPVLHGVLSRCIEYGIPFTANRGMMALAGLTEQQDAASPVLASLLEGQAHTAQPRGAVAGEPNEQGKTPGQVVLDTLVHPFGMDGGAPTEGTKEHVDSCVAYDRFEQAARGVVGYVSALPSVCLAMYKSASLLGGAVQESLRRPSITPSLGEPPTDTVPVAVGVPVPKALPPGSFDIMDTDKNGRLSFVELQTGLEFVFIEFLYERLVTTPPDRLVSQSCAFELLPVGKLDMEAARTRDGAKTLADRLGQRTAGMTDHSHHNGPWKSAPHVVNEPYWHVSNFFLSSMLQCGMHAIRGFSLRDEEQNGGVGSMYRRGAAYRVFAEWTESNHFDYDKIDDLDTLSTAPGVDRLGSSFRAQPGLLFERTTAILGDCWADFARLEKRYCVAVGRAHSVGDGTEAHTNLFSYGHTPIYRTGVQYAGGDPQPRLVFGQYPVLSKPELLAGLHFELDRIHGDDGSVLFPAVFQLSLPGRLMLGQAAEEQGRGRLTGLQASVLALDLPDGTAGLRQNDPDDEDLLAVATSRAAAHVRRRQSAAAQSAGHAFAGLSAGVAQTAGHRASQCQLSHTRPLASGVDLVFGKSTRRTLFSADDRGLRTVWQQKPATGWAAVKDAEAAATDAHRHPRHLEYSSLIFHFPEVTDGGKYRADAVQAAYIQLLLTKAMEPTVSFQPNMAVDLARGWDPAGSSWSPVFHYPPEHSPYRSRRFTFKYAADSVGKASTAEVPYNFVPAQGDNISAATLRPSTWLLGLVRRLMQPPDATSLTGFMMAEDPTVLRKLATYVWSRCQAEITVAAGLSGLLAHPQLALGLGLGRVGGGAALDISEDDSLASGVRGYDGDVDGLVTLGEVRGMWSERVRVLARNQLIHATAQGRSLSLGRVASDTRLRGWETVTTDLLDVSWIEAGSDTLPAYARLTSQQAVRFGDAQQSLDRWLQDRLVPEFLAAELQQDKTVWLPNKAPVQMTCVAHTKTTDPSRLAAWERGAHSLIDDVLVVSDDYVQSSVVTRLPRSMSIGLVSDANSQLSWMLGHVTARAVTVPQSLIAGTRWQDDAVRYTPARQETGYTAGDCMWWKGLWQVLREGTSQDSQDPNRFADATDLFNGPDWRREMLLRAPNGRRVPLSLFEMKGDGVSRHQAGSSLTPGKDIVSALVSGVISDDRELARSSGETQAAFGLPSSRRSATLLEESDAIGSVSVRTATFAEAPLDLNHMFHGLMWRVGLLTSVDRRWMRDVFGDADRNANGVVENGEIMGLMEEVFKREVIQTTGSSHFWYLVENAGRAGYSFGTGDKPLTYPHYQVTARSGKPANLEIPYALNHSHLLPGLLGLPVLTQHATVPLPGFFVPFRRQCVEMKQEDTFLSDVLSEWDADGRQRSCSDVCFDCALTEVLIALRRWMSDLDAASPFPEQFQHPHTLYGYPDAHIGNAIGMTRARVQELWREGFALEGVWLRDERPDLYKQVLKCVGGSRKIYDQLFQETELVSVAVNGGRIAVFPDTPGLLTPYEFANDPTALTLYYQQAVATCLEAASTHEKPPKPRTPVGNVTADMAQIDVARENSYELVPWSLLDSDGDWSISLKEWQAYFQRAAHSIMKEQRVRYEKQPGTPLYWSCVADVDELVEAFTANKTDFVFLSMDTGVLRTGDDAVSAGWVAPFDTRTVPAGLEDINSARSSSYSMDESPFDEPTVLQANDGQVMPTELLYHVFLPQHLRLLIHSRAQLWGDYCVHWFAPFDANQDRKVTAGETRDEWLRWTLHSAQSFLRERGAALPSTHKSSNGLSWALDVMASVKRSDSHFAQVLQCMIDRLLQVADALLTHIDSGALGEVLGAAGGDVTVEQATEGWVRSLGLGGDYPEGLHAMDSAQDTLTSPPVDFVTFVRFREVFKTAPSGLFNFCQGHIKPAASSTSKTGPAPSTSNGSAERPPTVRVTIVSDDHRPHDVSVTADAGSFIELGQDVDAIDDMITRGPLVSRLALASSNYAASTIPNAMYVALHDNLGSAVNRSVVRQLSRSLIETMTVRLTDSLTEHVLTEIQRPLLSTSMRYLTHAGVPVLARSLVEVITPSLTRSPSADYFCHFCLEGAEWTGNAQGWFASNDGENGKKKPFYCDYCKKSIASEYYQRYYAAWYGQYFADYYAEYYTLYLIPKAK